MKERPILMSAPMVRAILAGTKNQTRRVVKPQPTGFIGGPGVQMPDGTPAPLVPMDDTVPPFGREILCPYGHAGDRLWVRESWQVARETLDYETGGEYDVWEWPDELGDPRHHLKGDARFGTKAALFYAADGEDKNPGVFYDLIGIDNKTILRPKEINWRPSIHMPRWASRITLEITEVRLERLQDIGDEDCLAEGIYPTSTGLYPGSPRAAYQKLWEQINGPGSWEANPWVWAVSFKRVEAA